jgi:hypothetical protein
MSLFKSLLFLHGHFVRPPDEAEAPAAQRPDLFDALRLLGGRPMRKGHNFDVADPFELPEIRRDPVPRRPELAGCG